MLSVIKNYKQNGYNDDVNEAVTNTIVTKFSKIRNHNIHGR